MVCLGSLRASVELLQGGGINTGLRTGKAAYAKRRQALARHVLLLDLQLEVPGIPEVLLKVANIERLSRQEVPAHLLKVVRLAAHFILAELIALHFLAELLMKLAQRARRSFRILTAEVGAKGHLSIVQAVESIVVSLPLLVITVLVAVPETARLLFEPKNDLGSMHICVELIAFVQQLFEGLITAGVELVAASRRRPRSRGILLVVIGVVPVVATRELPPRWKGVARAHLSVQQLAEIFLVSFVHQK